MKHIILVPFSLLLFLLSISYLLSAGKLDDALKEIRERNEYGSSSSKRRSSHRHHRYDRYKNYDDDSDNSTGKLVGYILASPFWGPFKLLNDSFEYDTYFAGPPYKYGKVGYILIDRYSDPSSKPKDLDFFSFNPFIENSYDFDGVNRATVGLLLDTSFRLGIETGWTYFYEKLDSGGSDSFIIGDINLVFRFAQKEQVQFYAGLGGRFLLDVKDSKGFNFTYFVNIYPAEPISIGLSLDLGTLGEAFFIHTRFKVGAVLDIIELYVGFDYMGIGSVDFYGPMAGLQIWF